MKRKKSKATTKKTVSVVAPKDIQRTFTILPNGIVALSIKDAQEYDREKPYHG